MVLLSQRDPRWSFKTIGQSTSTIGAYGCTITGLSMLSDWYGGYKDPAWMAKNLSFLVDKVIWSSVTAKLSFKFVWRFYGYDEGRILPALAGKTTSCLLQVRGNHWVVGIKKVGSYYWIADPWDGKRKFINKSIISGGATFDAK
jgi:ABC-type bacteriocin/lantibiotic exporter with double-glycine peptidase domain